jgi:hypothetical protein
MTSSEFVLWLKGFVAGSHHHNLTPAGWDNIKEELNRVEDNGIDAIIDDGGISEYIKNQKTSPCVGHELASWEEEELEHRMNIIGQNGNEGLHYDKID